LENLGTVSYSPSIVTMAVLVSCIVLEIKRDIGRKSRFFTLLAFDAPIRGGGVPVRILTYHFVLKARMVWLTDGEKSLRICDYVCNR